MTLHSLNAGVRSQFVLVAHAILDLFFPPRCAACNRFGSRLCTSCLAEVEPLLPPICERCGRPTRVSGTCSICRRTPSSLDGTRSASILDEPLRSAVHDFKYRGARELADPLASLLVDCWQRNSLHADLVVPIPLHRNRQRERGYNQAALLARSLGDSLGLRTSEGEVHRQRATRPQVGLTAPQRRENVDGAFACSSGAMHGLSVVLVDDVCTSGATLEACAAALRTEGLARSIWALTVARARGLDDRVH